MKNLITVSLLMISTLGFAQAQKGGLPLQGRPNNLQVKVSSRRATTFCNPVNLDYTYKITESDKDISYRSGADLAVVTFRGSYYMFVTRALGYWYSKDLTRWRFIEPQRWYFQGSNAPAAHNYRDKLLFVTGDPSGTMSLLDTDDPQKGDWQAVPALLRNLQDPDFFMDDDARASCFGDPPTASRFAAMSSIPTTAFFRRPALLNCSIAMRRGTVGSALERIMMIPS